MKTAFVFPGQGSQFVGMGKDFYEKSQTARDIINLSNHILNFDIKRIIFEGPEEKLKLTENTQPAIFLISYAMFSCIQEKISDEKDIFVAGHSLGEYTALSSAKSIPFEQCLKIVRKRGELMQKAVSGVESKMTAIIGLKYTEVENIITNFENVWIANINEEQQIVISGKAESVILASEELKKRGAKTLELRVSAPFHCPLMEPAKKNLENDILTCDIKEPIFNFLSAHTASKEVSPNNIKNILINGIAEPVLWYQCVLKMKEYGVDQFVEVGPGKVLSGLIRRILKDDKKNKISNIEKYEDVQRFNPLK